ncbi:MAG: proton-conducting transporter membrane subunit [Erysipelotrichaceae bacterium]
MSFVQNFPFFTIIMTLSSGVISSVLSEKKARYFTLAVLVAVLIMSLMTLSFVLVNQLSYTYMMGHFDAPWGNVIRIGSLETLFASAFTGIMLLSLMGGLKELQRDVEDTKINLYYTLCLLLMSSLLVLIYTNDLFTSYVFVEINTIAACGLVMVRYRRGRALVATMRYLMMSLLGSGLFLIGICILYDLTGHLAMEYIAISVAQLAATGTYAFPLGVTIGLFSMGLAIKSACFPFHTWLPDVYNQSTIASSTILSSIVSKGYIFLLIKIFYRMIGETNNFEMRAANVLFAFGVIAMIFGSYKAMKVKSLKKMLAYSSVAQIGYIFLGIGLGTTYGLIAACMQILIHAITKALLFVSAGGIMNVSNRKQDFVSIQGAGFRDKLAGFGFIVGSLSMIGLPFFAGFTSKITLATAAIGEGSTKMIVALIALGISTLMNACYYVPAMMTLYTHPEHPVEYDSSRRNISYIIAMVSFIALNFIAGVYGQSLFDMVQNGIMLFK